MARVLKYKILSAEVNPGTGASASAQVLLDKEMGWNEINEETAKREAYNGEYTIEEVVDDGTD